MKKKTTLSEEDQALFRQLWRGLARLSRTRLSTDRSVRNQRSASKAVDSGAGRCQPLFSDEFQPLLNTEGPVKYVRPE